MSSRLSDKRLFIADMAMRLASMEDMNEPMHPLMYRVLAKRLRQALAGFPDQALAGTFGPLESQVAQALEDRHFEAFGQLISPGAAAVSRKARALFQSLGVRKLLHSQNDKPPGLN